MNNNHMLKRLTDWDYSSPCNYGITLVTEPRRPFLGSCEEWGIRRTLAGNAVFQAWQALPQAFPQLQASYYCIMPDHFHGILYVKERLPCHLDAVVEAFKKASGIAWAPGYQDTLCLHKGQLHRMIEYLLANPKRLWIKQHNRDLFRVRWHFSHPRLPPLDKKHTTEKGSIAPLDSRVTLALPRRSNERANPFLSCAFCSTPVAGWEPGDGSRWRSQPETLPDGPAEIQTAPQWTAIGNPFLLDSPLLISLRLSRRTPPAELADISRRVIGHAERGAVIVSPFFSPAERELRGAVIAAGGSVVTLASNGWTPCSKPSGEDFALCAAGRLLLLSPFDWEPGHGSFNKPRCELLNAFAAAIADYGEGWPRRS